VHEGLGAIHEFSRPTHLLASLGDRRTIAVPASLFSEVGGTCGRLGSHPAERDTSSLPQPSEVNLVERPATSDDAEFRAEVLLASRHLSGSID
jgi:hypothetical protein